MSRSGIIRALEQAEEGRSLFRHISGKILCLINRSIKNFKQCFIIPRKSDKINCAAFGLGAREISRCKIVLKKIKRLGLKILDFLHFDRAFPRRFISFVIAIFWTVVAAIVLILISEILS